MNHFQNHFHCCHKIKEWYQQEYIQKNNRSPYRQRSFETTLRTYPISKSLPKSLKSSRITKSNLHQTVNKQQKENKIYQNTINTPNQIPIIQQKHQSPIKNKMIFKQREDSNQSPLFLNIGFPFASEFQNINIYSQPQVENNMISSKQSISQQSPHSSQQKQNMNQNQNQNNIIGQLLALSLPLCQKKSKPVRKFSLRLLKRQFKDIWRKDKINQLVQTIIEKRHLFLEEDKSLTKAKLYSIIYNEFK